MERWPGEEPDRRIIEAAAIQLQALEVRIRRQQRPQQIQGWRDLEEVKGGEEGKGVGDDGAEGAAGGCGRAEGARIEAG